MYTHSKDGESREIRFLGRWLKPEELDIALIPSLTLDAFRRRDCAVVVGSLPGVYTFIDALVYTLDTTAPQVIRCDGRPAAEKAFLACKDLCQVKGREVDHRMRELAREALSYKCLLLLPETERLEGAKILGIKLVNQAPTSIVVGYGEGEENRTAYGLDTQSDLSLSAVGFGQASGPKSSA